MDLALSLGFVFVTLALAVAYAIAVLARGGGVHARVEKDGASALLGQNAMNVAYAFVGTLGEGARRLGITANQVTWFSLFVGLATAALLGAGHFGAATIAATIAAGSDALDGWLARAAGTASDAGEVFDATVDRYVELAFFAGLAVYFRENIALLLLVIGALSGSYMVSYATAKAEALRVSIPRGIMRRTERAVYLVWGVALVPLVRALPVRWALRWANAPCVAALVLIAVLANASAVHRLHALATALRSLSRTERG